MSNTQIYVGGNRWTVVNESQVHETLDGMRKFNRWWREGHGTIDTRPTSYPAQNPLTRSWLAEWVPGRAGWHVIPDTSQHAEGVHTNSSDGKKIVFVKAATAALAIERAKFLCMLGGRTS